MYSYLLVAEILIAAALPVLLLAEKRLQIRRDFLALGVYLQAFGYAHIAPFLHLQGLGESGFSSYATLEAFAVVLLDAVFLGTYCWIVGRSGNRPPEGVRLEISTRRLDLLLAVLLAFSVTFWMIAWSHGLIYRRLGGWGLVTEQLKLSFADFVVFRLYIEGLRFFVAVLVAAVVVAGSKVTVVRGITVSLIFLSAYLYLVINSRLDLTLDLLLALGIWALLWPGIRGFWPRFAIGAAMSVLLLFYSTSTTEKIRVLYTEKLEVPVRAFAPGVAPGVLPSTSREERAAPTPAIPPAASTAALSKPGAQAPPPPAASTAGSATDRGSGALSKGLEFASRTLSSTFFFRSAAETAVATRLDGLDLINQMKPALKSNGYAWGKAWKVPAALIVLPVTNPALAREYKLRFDTAAKNYLMRRYTNISSADYVSCILTDAYGNFGVLGFAAVGLVLGAGLGLSVRALLWPTRAILVVLALFFIAHLFQFEQEFVSVLLLWTKKLPMLLGVLILNPFRVAAGGPPSS